MTLDEFALFSAANDVDKVVFYRPAGFPNAWEIWAYDWEGSCALASFGNCLNNGDYPILYHSLDAAFSAVRAAGCKSPVTIDGGVL